MQKLLPQRLRAKDRTPDTPAIVALEKRPTAFIGACLRGPSDHPVLVNSQSGFERVFGSATPAAPLTFAVRMYFQNGGQEAWIVRVNHQATPAGIELQTDDIPLRLWAHCLGSHENLRAAIDYDGIETIDGDCFNLTLQRLAKPHTEHVIAQESYRYVSCLADHPNFIGQVLESSNLMRAEAPYPSSRPHITLNHRTGAAEYFRTIGIPGKDGLSLRMTDILGSSIEGTGLFAFTQGCDFEQLYIPPIALHSDLSVPLLRASARICERRRAILLVDAPRSWDSVKTALSMIERFSLRGPNIAIYYPWIMVTDPETGEAVEIPPGGAVAGALTRGMRQHGPGSAAAGHHMLLRGINRFADQVDEAASFRLSQRGINSLRRSKGGRKVIWDAVILTPNDGKKDQINSLKTRRLLHFIAHSIDHGLQWTRSVQNTEKLWKKIHDQVYEFLLQLMNRGLLQGSVPDGAFRVHCDLGTNPGILRRQHCVGLEIEVAPTLPSRFVKLSFQMPVAGGQADR